jgi:hypothetical protein
MWSARCGVRGVHEVDCTMWTAASARGGLRDVQDWTAGSARSDCAECKIGVRCNARFNAL